MTSINQSINAQCLGTSVFICRSLRDLAMLGTLVGILSTLLMPGVSLAQSKKREVSPTLVRIDAAKMLPSASVQSFVGSLEPVRRSVIGSAVEERLKEVYVEEGDFVDIQDGPVTLVRLRRDTIDIAVQLAEIQLQSQQKVFQELSATIPTQVASAEAEVARLDSQLQFARKVYDRIQTAGSSMSRREKDEAFSQFNSASQAMNVAQAELDRLRATRDIRLAISKQSIARQQAELARNVDLQSKHTVVAPFSGYVSRRLAERGTWVSRGTPLIELVQIDPIQLRVQVPQSFLPELQKSFNRATESSPLTAEVLLDSVEQTFRGTVFRISPDADQRTRSVPIIIRIDNPASNPQGGGHLLKPGLLARANLQFGTGEKVLMVPKDALVLNQGSASLFLLDRSSDKPVVRKINVETGNSNGNWIHVTGEIENDQEVVTQGNERLRDGETVEVLEN